MKKKNQMQQSSNAQRIDPIVTTVRTTGGKAADPVRFESNPPDIWVAGGILAGKTCVFKDDVVCSGTFFGNAYAERIETDRISEAFVGHGITFTSNIHIQSGTLFETQSVCAPSNQNLTLCTDTTKNIVLSTGAVDLVCGNLFNIANITNNNSCDEIIITSASIVLNPTTAVTITKPLGTSSGGTGLNGYETGDIMYATNPSTLQRLPIVGDGNILTCISGLPQWAPNDAGGGTVTLINTGGGLTGGPITNTGTISIANAGVTNTKLQNSSLTVTAGTGLSGGGLVALGGSIVLNNDGVTSALAGAGINVSAATGPVTFSIPNNAITNGMLQNSSLTVTAGSGLSGGGLIALGGSTMISIPNSGVTNAMLQNSSLTMTAGAGLSGGGLVSLGGVTMLSIPNAGVTNAMLVNNSITINAGVGMNGGGSVALGGSTTLNLTSPVITTLGGTGLTTYTMGDLLTYVAGTTLTRLPIGTNGQMLTVVGAQPSWQTLSSPASSVGTIITSMLTETQFQSLNGVAWVLMDGRNVMGSAYTTLTGFTTIPDARGAYIRGKNNGRVDGFQNPSGDLALGTFQNDQFQGHYHQNDSNALGGPEGFTSGGSIGNGWNVTTFAQTIISDGGNGTPRIGPETRVKCITINYFIKIN